MPLMKLIRLLGLTLALLAVAILLVDGRVIDGRELLGRDRALPWSAEAAALAEVPRGVAYIANEGSGTISVVNTATNAIVKTICLGSDPAIPGTPQPNGPCNADTQGSATFYNGQAAPSGLWLTPDASVLLVANRISSTIVAIDTATRTVLGYTPVGREPALATVRPGVYGRGRTLEAWVAIRGERHLDVLRLDRDVLYDQTIRRTERMPRIASVDTVLGPSMVAFTSDGRHAFVVAGKEARVDKIEASTRSLAAHRFLDSPFASFGRVTPDDQELYLVQKGAGRISILRTADLGDVGAPIEVGFRPNQVLFVGRLAYVSVGGPAPTSRNPDPAGKLVVIDRGTHAVVRELSGSAFGGEPSALGSTSNGRLYVARERGNKVTVVKIGNPDDPTDDVVEGAITGAAGDLFYQRRPVAIVINP